MNRSKSFFMLAAFAVFAVFGYMLSVTAQTTANSGNATLTERDVHAFCVTPAEVIYEALNSDTDIEPDLTCGGICTSECIDIGGVEYCATAEKSVCVLRLRARGIESQACWAEVCGGDGVSSVGTLRLNEGTEVSPSRLVFKPLEGDDPFAFPAKVYAVLWASFQQEGGPLMTNAEPILLEGQKPINAWPPKEEVKYSLMKPVVFTSADGKHSFTYKNATLTMANNKAVLAAN